MRWVSELAGHEEAHLRGYVRGPGLTVRALDLTDREERTDIALLRVVCKCGWRSKPWTPKPGARWIACTVAICDQTDDDHAYLSFIAHTSAVRVARSVDTEDFLKDARGEKP